MSDVKLAFGSATSLTFTLNSLASSATVGRECTAVDNSSNKMLDALVELTIAYPNSAPANDKGLYVYAAGSLDGTNWPEAVTGSDAGYTRKDPTSLRIIGFIPANQNVTARYGPFTVAPAFGGLMPAKWNLVVINFSGQTLSGSGNAAQYREVYATVAQMPAEVVRRAWGSARPPAGALVERRHPLARSLVGAIYVGAAGGIQDAVRPIAQPLLTARSSYGQGPMGTALNVANQTASAMDLGDRDDWDMGTDPFTLLVRHHTPTAYGSTALNTYALLFGRANATTTLSNYSIVILMRFQFGSSPPTTRYEVYLGDGAGNFNFITPGHTAIPADTLVDVAFIRTSSELQLWANGVLLATGTSTPRTVRATANSWFVGEWDTINLQWAAFRFSHAYIYKRDLHQAELQALYREPFAFFVPPAPTLFGALAGPASGSADLTGLGSLTATGEGDNFGEAALTGIGSLTATGEGAEPHFGEAALTGIGSLTATATSTQYDSAALTGLGSLSARGVDISTPPTLTAYWYPAGYPLDRSLEPFVPQIALSEHSAQWEEQLSEAGSGSYLMQNVEPDGTPIDRPSVGDVIAFNIGNTRAWSMLAEEFDRHRVREGGMGKQQTEVRGRGHLATLENALVYPTMGYASFPQQVDMYYDYRHVEYDDTSWALANHICVMSQAQVAGFWTGIAFVSWYAFTPGWFTGADDTHIIWGNGGTRFFAPAGKCYFRQPVFLPVDGVYDFYFGADDTGTAYLDGVPIAEATHFEEAPQKQQFKATFGFHILSVEATNADNGNPNNPGGIAYVCYLPSLGDPVAANVMFSSTQGNVKTKEYPPEPPGMTPGEALRLALELAQTTGDIGQVAWDFDDERDSAGNAWAVTPTISTKILTDLLTFTREVSASYCDLRMDPSSWTLHAYNVGTMNAADSGISFLPGVNVEGLEIRGDLKVANVAVGVTKFGLLEVPDPASVSQHGRRPALVEIGAVDNFWEALRVLLQALVEFARLREEISVQVDGVLGYVNYPLGKTITTVDSFDVEVPVRVVAIGVRQTSDTGRVTTTPTLKDIFLA